MLLTAGAMDYQRRNYSTNNFVVHCEVQDSFRLYGPGFRFQGSRFRAQGSGCRIQVLRVEVLGVRVSGSGFRVQGSATDDSSGWG